MASSKNKQILFIRYGHGECMQSNQKDKVKIKIRGWFERLVEGSRYDLDVM